MDTSGVDIQKFLTTDEKSEEESEEESDEKSDEESKETEFWKEKNWIYDISMNN